MCERLIIAAVSAATRDALLERFPMLEEDRVSVTPNGVDVRFFEEPSAEAVELARSRVGQGPFVLSVGNESPHKNHERGILAFMKAFEQIPELRFVIVRRAVRHDPRMVRLLRRADVAQRVILLDHVELAELVALYHLAEVFFFPSWVEGFGIPILEAMASGTPVVTSDRSAPAEAAGDAALLASPFSVREMAAALGRAHADQRIRGRLVELGKRRAREFSWRRSAEATLEAYARALQAR